MLKYALLGFLSYWPMTGYEIKQYITGSLAYFWNAELSQIYVTLKQLEVEGLVTGELHEQTDRPNKRVYTITEAGRRELADWVAKPVTEIQLVKDALLLKLFFSAQVDKHTLLAQLSIQRNLHQKQLANYRTDVAAGIEHERVTHPEFAADSYLWDATLRFGVLYEEAYIRWLDETITLIEQKF